MRLKGRKGNFQDVPNVVIGSVFFFFFLVIMLLVWQNWNDGVQAQPDSVIDPVIKNGSNNTFNVFKWIADFIIPILLVGALVFSVMSARLIPSSPKFFVVAFLFLILLPLGIMALHNIVDSFVSNSMVGGFLVSNLKITTFLLTHLVHVSVIYSFSVGIALLTKDDASAGFGGSR